MPIFTCPPGLALIPGALIPGGIEHAFRQNSMNGPFLLPFSVIVTRLVHIWGSFYLAVMCAGLCASL
jgi:hypothetical protein